jgi:hypothetical protein
MAILLLWSLLLHLWRLSTVSLPDDGVTTTFALWLCSYGFPPRFLEPLVRHNAFDDLLSNALGFNLQRGRSPCVLADAAQVLDT